MVINYRVSHKTRNTLFCQIAGLSRQLKSKYYMFSSCRFRDKIKLHKILEEGKCLFLPIWILRAHYGCPMELLGLLKSLWPQLVMYGPPTHLQWPPLVQYGPIWSSYGSLRVRYDPIWTHMSPCWLLMYTCRPYIGILYWQSWFLLLYVLSTFPMTNFNTIGGP